MKKTHYIISLLLLVLVIGCSKQSNVNISVQEYLTDNSSSERSVAEKIAWESLTEGEVESILPQTPVTIAKVASSKIPFQIENTNPTKVYKVTYATIIDPLVGPIGIYVDVDSSAIVGYDLRY